VVSGLSLYDNAQSTSDNLSSYRLVCYRKLTEMVFSCVQDEIWSRIQYITMYLVFISAGYMLKWVLHQYCACCINSFVVF